MKQIHPLTASAGAAVVLVTGYAWGSVGNVASPGTHATYAAYMTSDAARIVDGPDANPPPWPADGAKAPPPEASRKTTAQLLLPVSDTTRVPQPSMPPVPPKNVTFITTVQGEPLTIVWDN